MAVVDGVMGAAGHRLDATTDPYGRALLEQVARGEITADEAVRLSDDEVAGRLRRPLHPYYDRDADPAYVDAYSNRLVQFMGTTFLQERHPDSIPYKLAAKRQGRRDDEIRGLDPALMTDRGRASLLSHLRSSGRLDRALALYPNLEGLLIQWSADDQEEAGR